MEPIYIIGAGAIGKVLAVCLSNHGKKVVLLRGSVDQGETHREKIQVALTSQEIIEAEVTIDTLGNYRSLEGLVVLCNKSYGNAALADALKHKIGLAPIVLLQNGLGVEQAFMDFPAVYRAVLFVASQPLSDTKLHFKTVAVSPIGRIRGGDEASLGHIAGLLNTPQFGFKAERAIQPVIWKKAIINSVFNSVCPLLDTDNGIFHRNPKALQIAESLVAECLCVAGEQGVNLTLAEVMDSLLLISRSSDGQFISTLQDIRSHRPTEIATLNLAIAGMAATQQATIQTRLLGELTLLKSQL
ncbi:MAG: 2-dehydropantoate 2-reductase [Bacteroidota bacterium]|nr:2-dehydropantoate 2-reductase [Bacteroidota bacterium]MDP4260337.1 2-dehydropantoate 2-reductase [Bacteroidota bacterium]